VKTTMYLADGRVIEREPPETIEQFFEQSAAWLKRYPSGKPPDPDSDRRFLEVMQREPWKSFRKAQNVG